MFNDAYLAVNSSKSKFERAVEHFRCKLALDTLNPEETIGEDMYNAYKHVRYLEHYA